MRIEGTQGPGPQEYQAGPTKPPKTGESAPTDGAARTGPVGIPYSRQAAQADPINRVAVAEARKLLEEGKLDTPEAAMRAAEMLLDFGP